MKIASYRTNDGRDMLYNDVEAPAFEKYCGYVRTTEFAEVELIPLPPEVTVPAELARIDAAEAELREKFQIALNGLTERRQNLRALTHVVTA